MSLPSGPQRRVSAALVDDEPHANGRPAAGAEAAPVEPTAQEILAAEEEILQAMFGAQTEKADLMRSGVTLNVRRDGRLLFRIPARPLEPEEITALVETCTHWLPNPATGGRRADKFDQARYERMYLVRATLAQLPVKGRPGQLETMWEAYARAHGVIPVEDVLTRVMLGGEIAAVFEELERLGRYSTRDAIESAKNE